MQGGISEALRWFGPSWAAAYHPSAHTATVLQHLRAKCFSKPWVVYAKSPVSGAESTLEYLARYAYRVAIGDRRVQEITDDEVTFEYKDYKDGGKNKPMTLKGVE